MIAIVYLLKNSLKSVKYKVVFVLLPFLFIVASQILMVVNSSFGMDINGNCGLEAYDNDIYAIVFGFLIYLAVFSWTLINLFSYKNISFKIILNRKDFIQFYIKYCVLYFCFFLLVGIQMLFNYAAKEKILQNNIVYLKLFFISKIFNNLKIYLPLLTLIIRLDDPYIKRLF